VKKKKIDQVKVEHISVCVEDASEETKDITRQMDRVYDLLQDFLNLNKIPAHIAMNTFINAIPCLAKHQGMSFATYKTLMLATLDSFEKNWDLL
jgi:hypothetical protein